MMECRRPDRKIPAAMKTRATILSLHEVRRLWTLVIVSPLSTELTEHKVPWLILPVVICLSQRLSHACLSACRIKVKPRMAH